MTNNGPNTAAAGAVVTDAPPAGLTIVTMSGTGWSCAANSTTTSRDSVYEVALAAGASATPITVGSIVDATFAGGPLVNGASVAPVAGGPVDAVRTNDRSDATVTVVVPPEAAPPTPAAPGTPPPVPPTDVEEPARRRIPSMPFRQRAAKL